MKSILYQKKLSFWGLILLMTTFYYGHAQQGSFGNTFIHSSGEMTLFGLHNFQNGSAGILPGIIGSERTSPKGYLSFATGASWTGANATNHVDGYVRSYTSGSFIFPVGDNGVYQPVQLSASSPTVPSEVAYFNVSASSAITSSLKGGNEPVLPTGGAFSTTSKDANVSAVDNVEYWDINGVTTAKITLTWDANSAIGTLTGNNLTKLSVVAWDGTKWIKIASTVDGTSILGGSSGLTAGSITTDASVVPDTYNIYTLGSITTALTATNPPAQTATTNQAKTGTAGTDFTPSGGNGSYIYSVDNSGACTPVSGATALPLLSNLTVTNSLTGAYTYIAPATAGTYYYCIKVCDTTSPTPNCLTKTYTLTVTVPGACAAGSAVPSLK